ncbi:hypothetical protein ACP26C_13880 [Franconibacter helveticus 513]|uniref:hypothetical protein n=1 Tax=Franconibacter helveticus TaxID=357240 RepID=UPI00041137EC|nr:hypothetical protein [Franconibacter helveticus]EKY3117337.1 hypothetical protein [Cronobacter turicensis]
MTPDQAIALRAIAKRAMADITSAWASPDIRNKSQRDAEARKILLSYEKRYGFSVPRIIVEIGIVNGRIKHD